MRVFVGFIAAGIVALLGAAVLTLSGFYNVAATRPHFWLTYWWLELGLRRSVQFHAAAIEAPPLGDPAQVVRGFRHFQTGCIICHSARGLPASPTVWRLQPEAPDLTDKVASWSPAELFWIVKHGIKMTGMPAWEAQERDDEVWDLVAFLRELPRMSREQLEDISRIDAGEAAVQASEGRLIVLAGPPHKAEAACVRCHGFDGAGHPSGAFPRLSGLDAGYIHEALRQYARGMRPSGFMAPVARALSDNDMRLVAAHYASMPPAPSTASPADPAALQRGAALAAVGAPERGIEACVACHGRGGSVKPGVPTLAGQPAAYMVQQLGLWKDRHRNDPGDVMGRIARAMSDEEMQAAAAYYATLPADQRAPGDAAEK